MPHPRAWCRVSAWPCPLASYQGTTDKDRLPPGATSSDDQHATGRAGTLVSFPPGTRRALDSQSRRRAQEAGPRGDRRVRLAEPRPHLPREPVVPPSGPRGCSSSSGAGDRHSTEPTQPLRADSRPKNDGTGHPSTTGPPSPSQHSPLRSKRPTTRREARHSNPSRLQRPRHSPTFTRASSYWNSSRDRGRIDGLRISKSAFGRSHELRLSRLNRKIEIEARASLTSSNTPPLPPTPH